MPAISPHRPRPAPHLGVRLERASAFPTGAICRSSCALATSRLFAAVELDRSRREPVPEVGSDTDYPAGLTAREVLDELGGACEEAISAEIAKRGPKFTLDTRAVAVRGDYAMTRGQAVDAGGPRNGDQPLVRENGRWLLTTKAR